MNTRKDRLAGVKALLRSAEFRDQIQQQLQNTLDNYSDLQLLMVSTVDGRVFCHAGHDRIDPPRLAALGSTLMSVAETLGQEIEGGGLDYASLMLGKAVVISRRIADGSGVFTLTLAGSQNLNMAMALRLSCDTSGVVASSIKRQQQADFRPASSQTQNQSTPNQAIY